MANNYVEGDLLEFTPNYYLVRLTMGIVSVVIGIVVYLPICVFDKSVLDVTDIVFTSVFLICEVIAGCNIYYGTVGRRSRVKFTRIGLTVVDTNQIVHKFLWSGFEKAYMMGVSCQTALILSPREIKWKERKRAVAHADKFPIIINNDIVVVWCSAEHTKIKSILDDILPIVEDNYYLSPGIET